MSLVDNIDVLLESYNDDPRLVAMSVYDNAYETPRRDLENSLRWDPHILALTFSVMLADDDHWSTFFDAGNKASNTLLEYLAKKHRGLDVKKARTLARIGTAKISKTAAEALLGPFNEWEKVFETTMTSMMKKMAHTDLAEISVKPGDVSMSSDDLTPAQAKKAANLIAANRKRWGYA